MLLAIRTDKLNELIDTYACWISLITNTLSEINNWGYSFKKWKLPTRVLPLSLIKIIYQKVKHIQPYTILRLFNKNT